MRGFAHLLSSVGLETLLGNHAWFSQSLMRNQHAAAAFAQVGLESRGARINWLLPLDQDGGDVLPPLLDNLSLESALRGSRCLLAAARADGELFQHLRRAGFCIYGWQRFWQVFKDQFPDTQADAFSFNWCQPVAADSPEISSLRRQLISPSMQTVKKITGEKLPQYILKINGEIKGLAKINPYGSKVMVTPLLAQTSYPHTLILQSLYARLFPIYQIAYLVQTANMVGLEGTLTELADPVCDREELLVKHFTSMQKVPLAVLNSASPVRHADTIAPMLKSDMPQDNL